jgi:asparagine synthase (glutamine-hydrolysing)
MCGILGYIGKRSFDAGAFGQALDVMAARGPDDRGIYQEPEVLLGHRRLAIIDLSPGGHQPMELRPTSLGDHKTTDHGTTAARYVIVFNGEIYNYQAIRRDLEQRGAIFRSNSDTEVVLVAYAQKGAECLDDFRGMFAFAIYDRLERSVFLVRDRMGIKPLYLWRFPGGIAFASEVKALRALPGGPSQLDVMALWDYLLWGSVPEPYTITEGIECLPPATWLKWTAEGETQRLYWDFPAEEPRFKRREEALEALRPALREAVALRCIADVPVGAFLSGGVDSSSVVSLMRAAGQNDLRTFSISFPQTELDEAPFALKVAEQFNATHADIPVSDEMVQQDVDGFFAAMDQPTVDGLNTYLVSRYARQGGLTVALSGLGGDELFAGYPSFRRIQRAEPLLGRFQRTAAWTAGQVARRFSGRAKKLEAFGAPGTLSERLYFAARGVFMPSQARALLKPEVSVARRPLTTGGSSPLHRTMFLELRRYMHNQLLRDSDVFGMAHALEIRVPLIDHVVAELLFRTDPAVILEGIPKSLLLDALPAPLPRLCTHRPKMGFTFPFGRWMKTTWRPMIEATLLDPTNGAGELFDQRAVAQSWHDYLAGRLHWSRPWALYVAIRKCHRSEGRDQRSEAVVAGLQAATTSGL